MMEKKEIYDVIIVGGGPAGLSIGSELSKKFNVLIVEKKTVGRTSRSWFVPPDVLDESVKPFTYGGLSRFMASTFSGGHVCWKTKLFDKYPIVDEKTLLPHWVEVIKNNGSHVIDNCAYQDHVINDGIVTIKSEKGSFSSNLLIDASGYNSPILKKYNIKQRNLYWWSVYGSIGEHPNGLNGMQVGDYMMWQTFRDTNIHIDTSLANGRPVFEYEILKEDLSYSLILYLRKEQISKDVMEQEYKHAIRKEKSTKNFHDIEIKELKYGWYPSGGLSQQIAEDNVAFVGDSACWCTPCGWGMGFILNNYKYFAGQIGSLLEKNNLDKKSLLSLPHFKVHEKYEMLLNAVASHFLANATVPLLDRFIKLFHLVDPILCEKMFTLTMTQDEVRHVLKVALSLFDLRELIHIIPKEDYLLILDEARYFTEDAIIDSMYDLVDLFHKQKIKSRLNNGFDFSEGV